MHISLNNVGEQMPPVSPLPKGHLYTSSTSDQKHRSPKN